MNPTSGRKFFRREELDGKEVYDLEARHVGRVVDIGFSPSGEMGLIVEVDKDKTEFFEFTSVHAIRDIVLIRGGIAAACPNCGSSIKPGNVFCTKCGARL
jgi:sporulation protein YlmC with PRC-barrel domain